MTDLSAIPPAMTDIDEGVACLLGGPPCSVCRAATEALERRVRGGVIDQGPVPRTRSVVPPTNTHSQKQQEAIVPERQPATEARAGTRVVAVMEAEWERAYWAKLDNGLQLRIDYDEGRDVPRFVWDRAEGRTLNIIGQASILLGLPVPSYGFGAPL